MAPHTTTGLPCPLKPIRTAYLGEQDPQIVNRVRVSPCFSCWATHMNTLLHICYLYARMDRSNPWMLLFSGSVSGNHQVFRLTGHSWSFCNIPISFISSGFLSPSPNSYTTFPELNLMFGCGSLHLFGSGAENSYGRFLSASITEYHWYCQGLVLACLHLCRNKYVLETEGMATQWLVRLEIHPMGKNRSLIADSFALTLLHLYWRSLNNMCNIA